MEPRFKLQIVFPDGTRPRCFAGGGGEEQDLIATIAAAVVPNGIAFRTRAQVSKAIERALLQFKKQARQAL